MAQDKPRLVCAHKKRHHGVKTHICEWCGETYERPACWPKEQRFCCSWCARRWISKHRANENSPRYQHGVTSQGYRRIQINGKRWIEHRFVMTEVLGRPLRANEQVHHKNGNRLDNRPENLMVVLVSTHYHGVVCPCCDFEFAVK